MIVRNEADVVLETIASVVEHIDYWVVVDTGSDDGTQGLIREYFAARGVPGELHDRPWRNFGHNRTEALELAAGRADYTLVFDAGDLMVGSPNLTGLNADRYLLRFGSRSTCWQSRIFRSSLRWAYEGVLYEYERCLEDEHTHDRLTGEYHIEARRSGSRNRVPDEFERHIVLLQQALAVNPDDARTVFYLAQSHFDAGHDGLALAYYNRRSAMGGCGEEVFHSELQAAKCLERLGRPWEIVLAAYLECWQHRPSRAEPLHQIARHYRSTDQFDLAYLFAARAADIGFPESELMVVDHHVYDYGARDELAIAAFYTGRYQQSFDLCATLLADSALPDAERSRIEGNRDFSVPHVMTATAKYPGDIVAALVENKGASSASGVTLTMVTGGRRQQFELTVNSFLQCCTDLQLIDRWVCVDAGSSDDDFARMTAAYPFIEFIREPAAENGRAHHLNLLLDAVDTPYWLHLDDDWQFFPRADYITNALAVLNERSDIGQVVFNRNYAETLEDRWISGGLVHRTEAGMRFVAHEYLPQPIWLTAVHRHADWPHFALRPALTRTVAAREAGPFDEVDVGFECRSAEAYTECGWRTAFLDSISSVRIGAPSGRVDSWRPPRAALSTESVNKTALLSTIVSGESNSAGRSLGLAFIRHLEAFGVPIDVFGGSDAESFVSHRGGPTLSDRTAGLLPYRYTVAVEDRMEPNYFTDRIIDSVLGEALCFYWGCPNLEELIDPQVFIRLPLDDLVESSRIVQQAIADNEWSRRIGAIRGEKHRFLNETQLMPVLDRVVDGQRFLERLDIDVINLDRRPDRWASFVAAMTAAAGPSFSERCRRRSAIDGNSLSLSAELEHLFRGNDFQLRAGVVGCALSHVGAWRDVAKGDAPRLILEDDARLAVGVTGQLVEFFGALLRDCPNFDVAFLGATPRTAPTSIGPTSNVVGTRPIPMDWSGFGGGAFGYVVSPAGARRLSELVDRHGIQRAIDWFVVTHAKHLTVARCSPDLVVSPLAAAPTDDSDIQWNAAVVK